jgi:hypothetical protein
MGSNPTIRANGKASSSIQHAIGVHRRSVSNLDETVQGVQEGAIMDVRAANQNWERRPTTPNDCTSANLRAAAEAALKRELNIRPRMNTAMPSYGEKKVYEKSGPGPSPQATHYGAGDLAGHECLPVIGLAGLTG